MPPKLTNEIITAAIEGFESQKTRIDNQIAELKALLSGGPTETAATAEVHTGKRKRFSVAARRRMKEAQRARWAKIRGEVEPTAPTAPEAAKPKRQISEEGMKRIVAATKKRWRLARAAKAQAAAKKAAPARKKAAPARAAKKSAPARKAAVKKSARVAAPAVTEAAGPVSELAN